MQYAINDKLYLKSLSVHNAKALFGVIDKNRLHLRAWLPWLDDNTRVSHTESFIRTTNERNRNGDSCLLAIYFSGALVGMLGFTAIDSVHKVGVLGYWLDAEYEHQGIVTEATKVLISDMFARDVLNRVEIRSATDNLRSAGVAKRLHFTYEGTLRQAEQLYGRYIDLYVYSMLKNEWRVAQAKVVVPDARGI